MGKVYTIKEETLKELTGLFNSYFGGGTNLNSVAKWKTKLRERKLGEDISNTGIDTSGNIYNGTGWKEGYRLNSTGAEMVEVTKKIGGFIPLEMGEICTLLNPGLGQVNYINTYKADFSFYNTYQSNLYVSQLEIVPVFKEIKYIRISVDKGATIELRKHL